MKLKNYTLNQKELLLAMEALTAPGRLSFYQQEEIDLAGTKNISEHQKKYFWLKNSYNGAQLLFNDFFAERQRKVSKDIKEKMLEKMAIMEQKKLEVKKKFHLTSEIMDISKAISYGVGWQDERKKYILIVLGYQDLMLNEIARRFKYHKDDLCNAWYYEIARILKGDNLHNELKKRRPGFGVWYYKTCKNLTPQEVKYYWNTYQEKAISAEIKELKGVVASQGAKSFVKGRVKILLNPSEIKSFKDGEVLVAPMTSPEYIFAIRKASAIITDVGGLTQHAAVVSRELNIPCIVGTRNATQVLKDGDLVTLDIAKGLVKKVC